MYVNEFNIFKEFTLIILQYLKKFFYLMIMFNFLACCNPAFKVKKATYQIWCDHDKGLKGTNYHIVMKSYSNYKVIKIDSIFVQNKWEKRFHYSVLGSSNTDTCFRKNDEVILSIFVQDTINIKNFKVAFSKKNSRKKIVTVKNFIPLKNLCKN